MNRTDLIETPASIAIADKVRELNSQGIQVAKLQTGEPSFETPRYIIEGAYNAMLEGVTHYSTSQGLLELRRSLSSWYEKLYGIRVGAERFMVNAGAVHSIYCIMSALLDDESEVIIPEPFWPQYKYITTLVGGKVKNIDTTNSSHKLTAETLAANISDNSRILILNNPSNPTGAVYSAEEILSLLEVAYNKNLYVLFDEVYNQIVYSEQFASVLSLSEFERFQDRAIYINSFSKSFAMTGWRIGYAIASDSVIKRAVVVSQNSITNVCTFNQIGAIEALKQGLERDKTLEEMLSFYKERCFYLKKLLNRAGIQFIEPHGAFYFFLRCDKPSNEFAQLLLENDRIAVVPGSAYGQFYDFWYRISYAVDDKSYQCFLEWVKKQTR